MKTKEPSPPSFDRYRRLVESMPHIVWLTDPEGRVEFVNRRGETTLDLSVPAMAGWGWTDLLHPDDLQPCRELWREALETGVTFRTECRLRLADGSHGWFLGQAVPLRGAEDEIDGWVGTVTDIDDRKRVEERLARAARLLANVRDAVIVTDLDGNVTHWNEEATRLLGWTREEMMGQPLVEYLPGPVRVAIVEIARNLREGELWSGELRLARKDGSRVWVDGRIHCISDGGSRPSGLMGLYHDISERKAAEAELQRMEEQHRQAQKMEALGQLAGGIAHDFNNLLTVILGYGETLGEGLDEGSPLRSAVVEILRAGEHASALTRQLLAFSRKQVVTAETFCLSSVVRSTETMLRRLIGENIRLTTCLEPDPVYVEGDSGQIQQVLLNLAVNARDAMPEGGELTLATRSLDGDAGADELPGELTGGRWALLTVTDTGVGMSEEVQRHAFEPFFTTKAADRGTGLGLSVVYGIVEQSGGYVEVDSAPGEGTAFRVYLPRAEERKEPRKPQDVPAGLAPAVRDTTVLLVEDDDGVRTLAETTLRRAGYHVLAAERTGDALELAAEHGSLDLLVADVVLPGRGGRQLAERLRELHPDLKVLYISGYTDDAVLRDDVAGERAAFLHKPFSPAGLSAKVRQVLTG